MGRSIVIGRHVGESCGRIWSEHGDALLERPAKARRGKSGHLPIKPANDALQLVRDSRCLCSRLRPPCTTKRARAEGRWPWALPVAPAGSARAHSPPIVRGRASRGSVSCGSVSLPSPHDRSIVGGWRERPSAVRTGYSGGRSRGPCRADGVLENQPARGDPAAHSRHGREGLRPDGFAGSLATLCSSFERPQCAANGP